MNKTLTLKPTFNDAWLAKRELILGLIVLMLSTYLVYGMAGGLQNRLSQNPLLIAVLFGIFIGNVFNQPKFIKPAIDFSTAYLIKAGVVLVGLKISLPVVVDIGYKPVLMALFELSSVLLVAYFFMVKVMKFDSRLSLLVAAGSAVCGAAAVMAIAMVVRSKNSVTTLAVTLITLMGTLQLFAYPLMYQQGWFNQFDDQLYGIFAGISIYEFAQVYGAAYAVSDISINYGTLIKAIKVLLLIPLVFLIDYFYNKNRKEEKTNKVKFPVFLIYFIIVIVINSMFTINATVKFILENLGTFLFLMAMVALGLKTNLKNIAQENNVTKLALTTAVIIIFTTIVSYFFTLGTKYEVNYASDNSKAVFQLDEGYQKHYYTGELVFNRIGCNKCHVKNLSTRTGEPLRLYSDLLIHDMGPELDDKIIEGDAIGTDWRTAPLVGISQRKRFLHDGRAGNYRSAIIAHGGEAKIIRNRFVDLSSNDKQQLYKFLKTL